MWAVSSPLLARVPIGPGNPGTVRDRHGADRPGAAPQKPAMRSAGGPPAARRRSARRTRSAARGLDGRGVDAVGDQNVEGLQTLGVDREVGRHRAPPAAPAAMRGEWARKAQSPGSGTGAEPASVAPRAPAATPSRSTTVTSTPRSRRDYAVESPTIPAPITTAVRGAPSTIDAHDQAVPAAFRPVLGRCAAGPVNSRERPGVRRPARAGRGRTSSPPPDRIRGSPAAPGPGVGPWR
jgi:hypothetical protein